MGVEQSTGKTINDFLREYDELRTEYDNRMGEVKIYKKVSNPEIMVLSKERTFQDKTHFEQFMAKISRRQSLKNENISSLLLVIGKTTIALSDSRDNSKKEWCSEFYKLIMIYEYQERTLEQVLRHRRSYNDLSLTVLYFRDRFLPLEIRRRGCMEHCEGSGFGTEGFPRRKFASRRHPASQYLRAEQQELKTGRRLLHE